MPLAKKIRKFVPKLERYDIQGIGHSKEINLQGAERRAQRRRASYQPEVAETALLAAGLSSCSFWHTVVF